MSFLDLFKTKAAKVQDKTSPWQLISGQTSQEACNLTDLLHLNKSWVYVCNHKNALSIATTKLILLYRNTKGKKILNEHKAYNTDLIQLKAQEELVKIEKHPLLELLDKVNEQMNYVDFCTYIQEYLGLLGNAYVLVELKDGKPVKLTPLRSELVTEVVDGDKVISYKYREKDTYKPEQIIHLLNYAPGQLVAGKGELEFCLDAAQRYDYYDQLEKYLNKNNARPDFVVAYKGKISEAEQKDLYNMWYKKFGSVRNAGKPIVTSEVDILPIGFSPREMQYQIGREWAQREIMATYGVPEALININNANYSSSVEATNHYLKYTIYPKLSQYCSRLNEELVPYYDDSGKLFVWYEENFKGNPKEEADINVQYVQNGIKSIDEVRLSLGLQPIGKEQLNNKE